MENTDLNQDFKSLLLIGFPRGFTSTSQEIIVKATGLKNPGVSAGEVLNADRLSWEGLVDISEKLNRFDRYTKNLEAYPVIEEQLNKYREGFIVKDVVQPWLVLEYIKRNPHAYNVLFISRNIDEVIFCAKNIKAAEIITKMLQLEKHDVDFKIAQPETSFLIGSNSIDSQGDLYVMDINRINKPANRRNKRILDFSFGLIFLVLSPVLVWIFKEKGKFMRNCVGLIIGNISLVGYAKIDHVSNLKLPHIKRGILSSLMMVNKGDMDADAVARLNLIYAKNHSLIMDLKIIFKNFGKLDN